MKKYLVAGNDRIITVTDRYTNPAILKTVVETLIEMVNVEEGRYIIEEDELYNILEQKGIDLDDVDVYEILVELSNLLPLYEVEIVQVGDGRWWITVTKEFYENFKDIVNTTKTYLEELRLWRNETIEMFENFVSKVSSDEYRRIIRRLEKILSELSF